MALFTGTGDDVLEVQNSGGVNQATWGTDVAFI